MTFSLMPPTGSTNPLRLISPVIAVSLSTVRSVRSETSAMNIATPALGPSLGVAPAGTWIWMSVFSNREASIPYEPARLLTMLSAAWALSFITSPSWPVRISRPLPGVAVASMNRMSPPTGVHASPVATPGMLVRIATSSSNGGGPIMPERSPAEIAIGPVSPSAIRIAAWRSTRPISRSRFRTPASRV